MIRQLPKSHQSIALRSVQSDEIYSCSLSAKNNTNYRENAGTLPHSFLAANRNRSFRVKRRKDSRKIVSKVNKSGKTASC
jgi:hypothetical protein